MGALSRHVHCNEWDMAIRMGLQGCLAPASGPGGPRFVDLAQKPQAPMVFNAMVIFLHTSLRRV